MNRAQLNIIKESASGIIGGAVFIIFFFFLGLESVALRVTMAIIAGLAAFVGSRFILKSTKTEEERISTGDIIKITIDQANAKIAEIRSYSKRIFSTHVKQDLEELCLTAEKILEDYKKNPSDTNVFINYYLDSTTRIVKKYIEISEIRVKSPEIIKMLEKIEDSIDMVNRSVRKQIENNLADEMIDLDAEIKLLEKTIKTEGL